MLIIVGLRGEQFSIVYFQFFLGYNNLNFMAGF